MSKQRPSPIIRLSIRPPVVFDVFAHLIRAIGKTMDDLGIPHETSSEHAVTNEGDVVYLRDPEGKTLMTYDLQAFRAQGKA
jgi:hypothetical protein